MQSFFKITAAVFIATQAGAARQRFRSSVREGAGEAHLSFAADARLHGVDNLVADETTKVVLDMTIPRLEINTILVITP